MPKGGEQQLHLAEEADKSPVAAAIDIPAELQRREDRLAGTTRAKEAMAARAKQRHALKMEPCEAWLQRRAAHEKPTGKRIEKLSYLGSVECRGVSLWSTHQSP